MAKKKAPTELGSEKIGKLLMGYAMPAIIAMTASSLYNIVDSIFIGHGVGSLAISALAVTFPFMNLAAAFGAMVGVGASTLMSVRLGQKDYDSAKLILGNVVTMNTILGIAFTILGIIFLDPILYFFGASSETLPYAHDFMLIILYGNIVTHMYFGLNALLRSSGLPEKAMLATICSVLINICLNPFFIFVLHLGVRGSALATVISQVVTLCWQIYLFNNKNSFIHFQRGTFKLHRRIVSDSLSIGLSPFLMNLAACLIVILINQGLKRFGGDMAIGAFGIVNRVSFVFVMIVMGFNQGMQPIAGYNYGAKLYSRVTEVLKKTIWCATVVTTIGFLLGELCPGAIAAVFTTDKELISQSVMGLRITMVTFPIIGFQMVTGNFFQSIGMAKKAIFLSLTRQMIFLLPALLILPLFFQLDGIWYSMPVSDLLATVVSGSMLISQFRSFKRQSEDMPTQSMQG
jgi:putative MATE family efflux protein